MQTAIVTGANGFVGGAVTRELITNGYRVYALGRAEHHNNIPIDDRCIFIPIDLADIKELKHIISFQEAEIMFHLAWTGSAGDLRADTAIQLQNAQWTIDCLKVAKDIGCKRFVGAGSITEHETLAAAYSPGNRPGLGYIYGGGKVAAHTMSMSVAANIGMELVWAEITNAYGVGEKSPRLVNSTIQKCIRGESPLFTSGTQNYDFVYIDDVARAFRLIGENGKPFHSYVIGSGNARPLKEFLLEMKKVVDPNVEFIFGDVPFSGVNLPLSTFDCTETEKDTGFRAKVSFEEGCKKTYEWWRAIIE